MFVNNIRDFVDGNLVFTMCGWFEIIILLSKICPPDQDLLSPPDFGYLARYPEHTGFWISGRVFGWILAILINSPKSE